MATKTAHSSQELLKFALEVRHTIIGEGEGEDGDDDLRRAYERARGKMAARVAALTEAHAANRADRIKLLTNLVTASRMESWQNQSSLPNRE